MPYRPANIWDARMLCEMWAETVKEANVPFRSVEGEEAEKLYLNIIYAIKSDSHFTWILEVDDEIKGFISGHLHTITWGYPDIMGQLDCVYVDPEHRGKGHCDKLINLLKMWAGDNQATLITAETAYDPRLAKIWERKGWKPTQIIYGMEV